MGVSLRVMSDAPGNSEKVLTALSPLGDRLTSFVDAGLAAGELQESLELFLQWEAVNPRATETGPEITQSSRKSIVRPGWTRARLQVLTAAQSWPEYTSADSALPVRIGWMRSVTDWFTLNLIDALLTDRTRPCPGVSRLVQQVMAVVEGQVLKVRATVDLGGILVASPGMELQLGTTRITLRRPELTDLQPELSEHMAMLEGRELRHHTVSAIAAYRHGLGFSNRIPYRGGATPVYSATLCGCERSISKSERRIDISFARGYGDPHGRA